MEYLVRLTDRVVRDLEAIYNYIDAESSDQAFAWFNGLVQAVYSLEHFPERAPVTPENKRFRHLFYGSKPHIYRVIYAVDKTNRVVDVIHIRHGARIHE